MSDRTPEQIRTEIADERRRLDGDIDALHTELRSLVPYVIAGVVALALLSRGKRGRTGIRLVWKLL
jgi:hypothetical protein